VEILREMQPTIVVLPDPLDRHPDHYASGVFTLLALADLTRDGAPMPHLLAYLTHWPDWPPGWNALRPATRASNQALRLPSSLPDRGLDRVTLTLDRQEEAGKRDALALYRSQQEAMPSVLAAFVRRTEPFIVLTGNEVRHAEDPGRAAP
jgi:LmbE family N-acetylglucosaminyl deacetylase